MKLRNLLFPITFLISITNSIAKDPASVQRDGIDKPTNRSMIIDQNDTVVFDLSQATVNGTTLEFPVSILSDDTVYALDFSLKYDHSKLAYDTTLNKTTYMSALSYYNVNDSTVRFTSNSSHRYSNDTILAVIRFTILSGPLMEADLNTLAAYLNGDPCSVKITNYLINNINAMMPGNTEFDTYPNPVTDELRIHSTYKGRFTLTDIAGRQLYIQKELKDPGTYSIDLNDIPEGIYIANMNVEGWTVSHKIIVAAH
jgi:hypothetical protein